MLLWADVRHALRLMAKDRAFTALAVLTLSLGIGVTGAVVIIVNAVLLRGLPYDQPDRLAYVGVRAADRGLASQVSLPEYGDWRGAARSFEDLAAFTGSTVTISGDERAPESARAAWVTANAFRVLGQDLLLGRDFLAGEDAPGAAPVVILGYGLWQGRFAGDAGILGRAVKIDQMPSVVIGVMPDGMTFPFRTDLWLPLIPTPERNRREARVVNMFGRLRDEVRLADAQAEATALAARLERDHPANRGFRDAVAMSLNDRMNGGEIKQALLSLAGAVAFVLLIACANVGNLLLARSASRAREMAVRLALGATRGRIVRQLFVEHALLAAAGGLAGLGLASLAVRLFARSVDNVQPGWIRFTMDLPVLAAFAGICMTATVLFGLAPALQASRTSLTGTLRDGGRQATTRGARRFTAMTVVGELALTVVLLAGAGLMIRSFLQLYTLDLGFRAADLTLITLRLPPRVYPDAADRLQFRDRLAARMRAVPGVESLTFVSEPPLRAPTRALELEGRPALTNGERPRVAAVAVDSDYFETLGLRLRRGRAFRDSDDRADTAVAVVDERFVGRFFSGGGAIGTRLRVSDRGETSNWLTIVGTAPPIRQSGAQDLVADPVVYVPFGMEAPTTVGILVRSRAPLETLAPVLRRAVQDVDPDQAVASIRSLEEYLADWRWPYRTFGSLFAVFALIALVLSAVGIYATVAYSVVRRTLEIGVRMALGARRAQVWWLVLREGMVRLAIGIGVGLAGALALSRLIGSLLAQIGPNDPVTFVSATLVLVLVTFAACLLPARRATRLDPAVALRLE